MLSVSTRDASKLYLKEVVTKVGSQMYLRSTLKAMKLVAVVAYIFFFLPANHLHASFLLSHMFYRLTKNDTSQDQV